MNPPRILGAARSARSHRLAQAVAATVALSLVVGVGAAFAYWAFTDSSNTNVAVAAAQTLPQGATPSASVSGATVTVTFSMVSTTSGAQITTYSSTRYNASTNAAAAISGTCSVSASAVTCSDTPGDGQWKYSDTPTIANWVGVESAKSSAVTVDTTAPVVTVNPVATPTNNATPAFSGGYGFAAGDNAAVSVTVYAGTGTGGTVKATPTATLNTTSHTWSTSALGVALTPDGTYTVAVRQTDTSANTGLATSTFVLDTVAPTLPTPVASATGSSGSNPMYVNGATVTFTSSASDAGSGVAAVSYYYCLASFSNCRSNNWASIGTSSTSAVGFAVTSAAPLAADGAYKVVAVATDNAGNASGVSNPLLVTVDTTPPTVSRPTVNGNT